FVLMFFFFFQAEDGIRDKLVTGVQTCALPIFEGLIPRRLAHEAGLGERRPRRRRVRGRMAVAAGGRRYGASSLGHLRAEMRGVRSEERRVGKECRARWARCG